MNKNIPVYIKNRKVIETVIRIDHPQQVGFIAGTHLINCELLIMVPARGIIISNSIFENCHIVAKRKQHNHQWFSNSFLNCKFSGKFHGCEFGSRLKWSKDDNEGFVECCNFKDAELHYCSISNSVLNTNEFPPLPHFLILSPSDMGETYKFPKSDYWESERQTLLKRDNVNAHIYNWDILKIKESLPESDLAILLESPGIIYSR